MFKSDRLKFFTRGVGGIFILARRAPHGDHSLDEIVVAHDWVQKMDGYNDYQGSEMYQLSQPYRFCLCYCIFSFGYNCIFYICCLYFSYVIATCHDHYLCLLEEDGFLYPVLRW